MKKWLWCPGFGQSSYAGAVMGYVSTVQGYGELKLAPLDLAVRYRTNPAAIRKILQRLVDDEVLVKLRRSKYKLSPAGMMKLEEFKTVSFDPELLDRGMTPKEAAIVSAVARAKTLTIAAEWVGVSNQVVTRAIQKRDTAENSEAVSEIEKRDTAQPQSGTQRKPSGTQRKEKRDTAESIPYTPDLPDKIALLESDGFSRAADLICNLFGLASLPPLQITTMRQAWVHTKAVSRPPYTDDQILEGIRWIFDNYKPRTSGYIYTALMADKPGDHPAGLALAIQRKEAEDEKVKFQKQHQEDLESVTDPLWRDYVQTMYSNHTTDATGKADKDHAERVRVQANRIIRKGK